MPIPNRRRSSSSSSAMKGPTFSFMKNLLLCLSLLLTLFLLLRTRLPPRLSAAISFASPAAATSSSSSSSPHSPTTRRHLLFAIASSASSWPNRKPYVRLWYSPSASTRAFVFLDRNDSGGPDPTVPPVVTSADTSRFPYTLQGGLRSAVRVARVVKEAVELAGEEGDGGGVRWFVFGDDDTVFFVENLASVLSKYDHERWFYVGTNSESYFQNTMNYFSMAFGGGGFAISASLARALARVFDSCLLRYAHLYGSDARVYSCVSELGVGLTHEPGFHQMDVHGNLLGLLASHPLSPLLTLHHFDAVDPIFPGSNRTESVRRLFEAVHVDPARVLQQTVCYDRARGFTVSVAWGYAVQVHQGNELLPGLLAAAKTFSPWRRGNAPAMKYFMFDTRDFPRDACRRPALFYLKSVVSNSNGVRSKYALYNPGNCPRIDAIKNVESITVFSSKLELGVEEVKAMRRQCCDILPAFNESMVISIRKCRVDELISMHT